MIKLERDKDFKRNLPASQLHLIFKVGRENSTSISGRGVISRNTQYFLGRNFGFY